MRKMFMSGAFNASLMWEREASKLWVRWKRIAAVINKATKLKLHHSPKENFAAIREI